MWHKKKAARLLFGAGLLGLSAVAFGLAPTTLTDPLYGSSGSLRYYYGSAVALSPDGSLAIVAANAGGYQIEPNAPASVYVFQYAGGAWGAAPIITLSDPLANPACGDASPTDDFAYGVAVSGINDGGFLLAVGSPAGGTLLPCSSSPSNVTYGVVYLYQCTLIPASCGSPVAVLADPAASPSAGDNFGAAMAVSEDGRTVLVGAPGSSGSAPPGGGTPGPGVLGAAYLFTATSGTWPALPSAKLSNPSGACQLTGTAPYQQNLCDQFGHAVALSTSGSSLTALIGAPGAAVSTAGSTQLGAGQAFIFGNGTGSWTLETTFADPALPPLSDEFGFAVALSADGTKALIGAPNTAAPLAIYGEVGAANLYVQSGGTWQGVSAPAVTFTNPQIPASFPPPAPYNSGYAGTGGYGTSVGLSSDGTMLIVGLPEALEGSNSQNYGGTGLADVYTCNYAATPVACPATTTLLDPPALTQVNGVYPSPMDFFGASVAISGDGAVLLSGAPDTNSPAGGTTVDSGAAYVYGAPVAAQSATLSIALAAAPASSIAAGGTLSYELTVTNTSASASASSLSLTDVLPAGTTYESSSGGAGACTASTAAGSTTVTCTLAALAATATWQPSITVIAGNAGTIADSAKIVAAGIAATSSNTVSTVIVAPPTASNGSLTTGENTAKSGILIASDPGSALPLSYAILANPAHGSVALTAATGAYTYTPNTGYHGADSFTFDATNGTATSAPATITITVSASQLTLSYSGPNAVAVTPGQQLTYTATVANVGAVPADNLALSVSVPSGVTLVSYATPIGTCTGGGTAVSCTLTTLDSAPWVLTVVVSVNAADSANTVLASSAHLSFSNGTSPPPVNAGVTVAAGAGGGGGGSGGGGLGWVEVLGLAGLTLIARRGRLS